MEKKEKIVLFTHGIDIDGYGCAVLAKLAFENVQIFYADNFDIDQVFMREWKRGTLDDCDEVFVTDHCPTMELCLKIDSDQSLSEKMIVFDHHITRKNEQGILPWVNVVEEIDGTKTCGTSLFYMTLCANGLLKPEAGLDEFVELTRQYDTWDWTKTNNQKAKTLNTLAMAIGREEYVERMTRRLFKMNKVFMWSAQDMQDISDFEREFNAKLQKYVLDIRIVEFQGHRAGYVEIEDMFKNDIVSVVRGIPMHKEIDFLMMPIKERGTVSLRSVKSDFDVSKVAKANGGNGHVAAASFPLENLRKNIGERNFEK